MGGVESFFIFQLKPFQEIFLNPRTPGNWLREYSRYDWNDFKFSDFFFFPRFCVQEEILAHPGIVRAGAVTHP